MNKNSENTVRISKKEYQELLSFKKDYLYLKQEMEKLKRLLFASKSERYISENGDNQLNLPFDEEEKKQEDKQTEATETEEIKYQRKKTKKKSKAPIRLASPSHLARKEEVIEPKDKREGDKKIGELVTEYLDYKPSEVYVRKIVRPKYARKSEE